MYDNEERQTPVSEGDEKPFWDGWSPEKLGIGGEEVGVTSFEKL